MSNRTDNPAAIRRVAQTAALLTLLGHDRAAEALRRQLGNVQTAIVLADDRMPEGWDAIVSLAWMTADPSLGLPRGGDRVRVEFDGEREPIEGTWNYAEPALETSVGEFWVVDDETGRVVDAAELHEAARIGVVRMGERHTGWERHVAAATVVLRSAWGVPTTLVDEYDPLNYCHGCDTEAVGHLACAHTPSCTCRTCHIAATRRPNSCVECSATTRYRVSAWAPVPQYAAAVGLDEDQADTIDLSEPGESAAGYVCSAECARRWIEDAQDRLRESLGDREAARQHFSMTRWTYTPSPLDLPRPLVQARAAARYLTEYLDTISEQWFHGSTSPLSRVPVPYGVQGLRARVAEVVDVVAAMPERPATRLWPPSLIGLGAPAADLPQSLAHATQADPARYQVGTATVYDRVDEVYLCFACPVRTPVPILAVDVVAGTLADDMPLLCRGCDAELVAPNAAAKS